ncbi:Neurochondrin [Frankliniella fusca]|uniref:Neurochondrin n=1 Tax=Frankliniella fusca TaxID=407009 RepID=A0AAE1HMV2_9NEOP|nr:Neurochondrin [Frankliniella fusca]
MDHACRREVTDILRLDMMHFSCFVYPKGYEYQRVAEKLVRKYPSLKDITIPGTNTDGAFSLKCELVASFNRYRRSTGKNNPDIEEARANAGLTSRRSAPGGLRADKPGDKARRLCDPNCMDIPVEEGIVPDGPTEEICELLAQEWEKPEPNINTIILRLNLTARNRQALFKNGSAKDALSKYPPLRDPFHIFNDMDRFYRRNMPGLVKDYFTPERCDGAIHMLRTCGRVRQVTKSYLNMANRDEHEGTEEKWGNYKGRFNQ